MSEQTTEQTRPSRLERLLGDRPGALVLRLVLISLVVGFLMAMFGLNPQSLINTAIDLVRDALRDSTGLLRSVAGYVVTGAAIVVPVWLVLRLTSRRR
ncbi:MAG: DUF6460 domain-containing protein [Devosia sp.]